MSSNYEGEFRLIIDPPAQGHWNMAVDEAILKTVAENQSMPVIRLYGFSPPTLSIGCFQKVETLCNLDTLETEHFVRRPTGGSAVYHCHELTYSVVLAKNHLHPFGKRPAYRYILPLLLSGLKELGVKANSVPSGVQSGNGTKHPDCFARSGDYEIDSIDGQKLIGSAQMVHRHALLQHGSLPLNSANRAITRFISNRYQVNDHAADLTALLGRAVSFDEAQAAFIQALKKELNLVISQLTPSEEEIARSLLAKKYTRDQWNRKY